MAALRLPELRKLASELGLKGTSALRKGDLIAAISGAQAGDKPAAAGSKPKASAKKASSRNNAPAQEAAPEGDVQQQEGSKQSAAQQSEQEEHQPKRRRRAVRTSQVDPAEQDHAEDQSKGSKDSKDQDAKGSKDANDSKDKDSKDNNAEREDNERYESRSAARRARRNRARREQRDDRDNNQQQDAERDQRQDQRQDDDAEQDKREKRGRNDRNDRGGDRGDRNNDRGDRNNDRNDRNNDRGDNNERGNRRNRRNRRGREDNRNDNRGDAQQNNNQPRDDEQLLDVAGILDIVDNNVAFIRTTGYHAGPADVYVNGQMVRRFGLRAGDAIIGKARANNDQGGRGRNRQKYNPLVRVDSVNGVGVEEAKQRPQFSKLTPLYPNQRLRLETDPKILTTRVIDLIMPIGKGQRALIVSPPKAGKTTILQNVANAIATNNPECYLMVVLVDERPEEVTDMQRSVKGEVIASTFDRPPSEHTAVAELAIERAKRLVEQGLDVVVLLDSITRLGRAYNNSSPASGRILSGGVDSNALYPPKRFLGAARNIENGGSLTIIATAMVETGSAGDTVIFEEFKGTGNAELKLDRKISERRVFPAVDVNPSGTRKDELLLPPEEARVMHKLRRILSALDSQAAIDLLIKQLKKTRNNGEFLMQVMSSAPMAADSEEE
ncbi:transcription termination factor Rho [Corynebacterium pelargi]|uniref:transcription termination factor Rho n=1 Tax=Corynebacterium pelargi TaxID=1471400 RepID=UPI003530F46E